MSITEKRLQNYLINWWRQFNADSLETKNRLTDSTVNDVAENFKQDKAFRRLEISTLSSLPNFAVLLNLVKSLSPTPSDEEAALIASALMRAEKGNKVLKKTTFAGALLTVVALALRNILRGR
ncbi:MAG: hypothetical protein M1374_08030 [Firmicutes bacterium]|jgi:hypothetical protein|nr:hypothetical protein [Bacillota bacterium]